MRTRFVECRKFWRLDAPVLAEPALMEMMGGRGQCDGLFDLLTSWRILPATWLQQARPPERTFNESIPNILALGQQVLNQRRNVLRSLCEGGS